MSDSQPTPSSSRFAGQSAPRPVGTPPVQGERPSFDELMAQSDERDYRPLVEHLDDRDRDALGLPPTPQPVTVDGALADRIRDYYFTHPDLLRKLPDSVRDLINL